MKNLILLLFVFSISYAHAQMIEYRTLNDQPVFPKYSLNLDLMNMDVNAGNFDNLSINVGLWGYASIAGGLEAQFTIRQSYLQLARLVNKQYVGNTEVNLGAAFFLKKFNRNENVRVILKQKTFGDGSTLTTSIKVPATIAYKLGVQGGVHFRSSPYGAEVGDLNMTNTGIYAGAVLRRSNSVKIQLAKNNNTISNSANYDFFADALILPFNTFKYSDNRTSITDADRDIIKAFPIGFRAGCRLYQADVKANTGRRLGICYTSSFGHKPYQGWFLEFGLGITLLKK
jgi:hypothetical protein